MVEAREEETWVVEVEAWAEKASQLLPFLTDFPAILEGYAGVSFEYPYLQAHFVMVRVD